MKNTHGRVLILVKLQASSGEDSVFLRFATGKLHSGVSLRSSINSAIHQKRQNDVLRGNMSIDVSPFSKVLVFIVQFFYTSSTTIEKKYQN